MERRKDQWYNVGNSHNIDLGTKRYKTEERLRMLLLYAAPKVKEVGLYAVSLLDKGWETGSTICPNWERREDGGGRLIKGWKDQNLGKKGISQTSVRTGGICVKIRGQCPEAEDKMIGPTFKLTSVNTNDECGFENTLCWVRRTPDTLLCPGFPGYGWDCHGEITQKQN